MNGKQHRQLTESIRSILTEEKKKKPLDPVGKEDEDIDNDGDTDKTDDYLLNRRKKRKEEIEKAKKTKAKKPKKTLNERKFEVLTLLLGEENGGDADSAHPFDAESTAGDIHVASMHDHIEDHGGIPLTSDNVKKHGLVHDHIKEPEKTYYEIDATKGDLKGHPLELHSFEGPNKEVAHGLFSNKHRGLGSPAYAQHPHFPGKRVHNFETGSVISHHDIPEVGINENKSFSRKELTEATMDRIKVIGKANKKFRDSHPAMDRFR